MRPHSRALFILFAGLSAGATAIALTAAAGSASAAASRPRFTLAGSTPGWLSQARNLGATRSGQHVNFGVLLNMRNTAGAAATLQAISTPGSASYGHWLSNKQFDARYGPVRSSVSAVQRWMRSQGFRITTTLPSGMYMEATGSVAQIDRTFNTAVRNYSYRGKLVHANSTALSFPASTPAAVRSAVGGLLGIDQGSELKQPADTLPGPPPGAHYGVQPCSSYYGQKIATNKPEAYGKHQPYVICGYTPGQYQSAYGETPLLKRGINGHGVTVAITDAYAAPTIYSDAQRYSKVHGQPQFTHGQFTQKRRPRMATTWRRRADRRAGTARKPSTSRPCTQWLPARRLFTWGPRTGRRPERGLGQRDRPPHRQCDHQLLDPRHGQHQEHRPGATEVLRAVFDGSRDDWHHGQLLLRGLR